MTNKWAKQLFLKTPQIIKGPIIRKIIKFPMEIDKGLRFKVAETKEELEEAFRLLHDAYVREGLMKPQPSGLRVTKYHALPSTTTLLALLDGEIVGTVSLVRQSAFGIPLQSIFSVPLLDKTCRVAEVSSLAVKKGFNKQQGRILFPLLKFMYHYSVEYFGVTHFVIAVNPKWIDFYRSVLLFTDLTQKPVSSYDFVDGAPAYGAILDLRWAKWEYSRVYGTKKTNHNLSYFFQELECTNMEFPLRNKSLISDPVMSPELMEYFFIKRTQVFESLSEMEKFVLREMYNSPGYHQLIPEPTVVQMRSRKRKRLETNLDGRLYAKDSDTPIKVQIQSISEKGLGGYLPEKIEQGRYTIHVNVEGQGPCIITGHIARISEEGAFGFVIDSISREWLNFFNSVDGRIILDAKAFKNSKSKTG